MRMYCCPISTYDRVPSKQAVPQEQNYNGQQEEIRKTLSSRVHPRLLQITDKRILTSSPGYPYVVFCYILSHIYKLNIAKLLCYIT